MAAAKARQSGASDRAIACVVVTPESTVLETTATFIVLPLFDGEIGIAPAHSPMVGRLGFGEMRVVQDDQTRRYYVDGGFVQVVNNSVTILTPRALPATDVDIDHATEKLAALRASAAHGDAQIAHRARRIAQVRAQIRVAQQVD
jgi:F-type H+-transporting ATPase subunit epsilon